MTGRVVQMVRDDFRGWLALAWAGVLAGALMAAAAPVAAQVTAFRQAVAETAADDPDLAAFYRARDFAGLWTGPEDGPRRAALLAAFADAARHGLPAHRYDPDALRARMAAADTAEAQGRLDVDMSRLFLSYARDVQTGILEPGRVATAIRREVPLRDRLDLLNGFADAHPAGFLRALPPSSPEYGRLMRARIELGAQQSRGGWGPTVPGTLAPGDSGPAVVALRNRLIAQGFMERSATATYDAGLTAAVQRFQASVGLEADGVAGETTIREINRSIPERLQQILVAMERERWINQPLGDRHIWVNLTDFTARIVDHGAVTFETRSVIGHRDSDRQSPEFSDQMEFMVINPSWYVPRSIIVKEYLPALQRNRNAAGHIQITDSRGRVVNRGAVDFSQYTARSFPFAMRQPPSRSNALGLVKFMFPNRYNIYLHDTPAKSLFSREVRAFSHGCIRLNDPFDFAYALLARQTDDPEGLFRRHLNSGRETRVDLEQPVPVHIVYRTAFASADGTMNYRGDVYGRDRAIWTALEAAGVAVLAAEG